MHCDINPTVLWPIYFINQKEALSGGATTYLHSVFENWSSHDNCTIIMDDT